MNIIWCAIALVVVMITKWWYRWSNPKCNGKLPPGSMGFPIIGETLSFFETSGLYEISPFVRKRMSRYGPLFRTNMFGINTVVSTDMDANFNILRQENTSFVVNYENSIGRTLGENNIMGQHGKIHKHIKQIILGFLGPEGLKRTIIGDLDRMTQKYLRSKVSQASFNVEDALSDFIVEYLTPKVISNLKQEKETKLTDYIKGFNAKWFKPSISLSNLRALSKVLTARTGAVRMIHDICTWRKEEASREKHLDFLDTLLEDLERDGSLLSQGSIENITFFLIFAARETTPKALCLALQLLSENPKVLAELKREHAAILESRENKESGVSWEEYKQKMSFTSMVINEVLRLGNLAPILFRKAVKDVEINGYTIPAGWNVAVIPTIVHYDHNIYENPLEFNPWRWEGKDVRLGSKKFMALGSGVRQCVGAEFMRLMISIYLHYLVTNYDFTVVQDCEVIRSGGVFFKKSLCIKLTPSIPHTLVPPSTSK